MPAADLATSVAVDTASVSPSVFEPRRQLVAGVVIGDIDVQFALLRQSGEREITAAEEADGRTHWVVPKQEVQLRVQCVAKIEFHHDFARFDLRGQAAQSGFICVRGRAQSQLIAKVAGQRLLQAHCGLLV
jgi:hypothetical protein